MDPCIGIRSLTLLQASGAAGALTTDSAGGTPTLLLIVAALLLGLLIGWLLTGSQHRKRLESANRQIMEAENEAAQLRIERDRYSNHAAQLQRERHEANVAETTPNEALLRAAYAERDRLKPLLLSTEKALAEKQAEKDQILHQLEQLSGQVAHLQNEVSQLRSGTHSHSAKTTHSSYVDPHVDFDPHTTPHLPVPPPAQKPVPDKLQIIEGIGPKIEQLLNEAGIYTFQRLSETPVRLLRELLHNAGAQYQMHDPQTWPRQAELAAAGDWDAFAALTDKLKAGRL